jgi:kinetochore protein Nuf2
MVLEWFAELLMNTTRETVEPAMRAAAQDICGDYSDIVSGDTRNLMGFFMSLRRLMIEVGLRFTSTDGEKNPNKLRIVRSERFHILGPNATDI